MLEVLQVLQAGWHVGDARMVLFDRPQGMFREPLLVGPMPWPWTLWAQGVVGLFRRGYEDDPRDVGQPQGQHQGT